MKGPGLKGPMGPAGPGPPGPGPTGQRGPWKEENGTRSVKGEPSQEPGPGLQNPP